MNGQASEQTVHDRINFFRLVRKLEAAVAAEDWVADGRVPAPWIKTKGTLQKVKYARKLLKRVELREDMSNSAARVRYEQLRNTLDRLENLVLEVDQRITPKPSRPPPILPSLPMPKAPPNLAVDPVERTQSLETQTLSDDSSIPAFPSAQDLLLSAPDDGIPKIRPLLNPSESLLPTSDSSPPVPPPSVPTPSRPAAASPAYLQNSAAAHEELSAQLAAMAAQLKRNALHFSGALEADQAVVQSAQEKLERNHDVMTKERFRLRDVSGKTWGTTWITLLSLVVVLIAFVLTFFVIRIT